jgi:hypothetical protein
MYQRIKDRFGTAGLVVAVIALVAAVGGTALAAGGLTKSQEKQVTKIAKKYAGKPGAIGPAGANGTNGTNGAAGAKGADGESVDVNTYAGPECATATEEGAELTNTTGTVYVCNGENGIEGSPWTAGGTLPSGKTETGVWGGIAAAGPNVFPMSFSLPLALPLDAAHAIGIKEGASVPAECENTTHAGTASPTNPEADPGYVCAYLAFDSSESENSVAVKNLAIANGASTAGAYLFFGSPEPAFLTGTYAVTAP